MQLDNDTQNIVEWAFKGLVSSIFGVGVYLWSKLVAMVTQTKDDLTAHKLHVSESYAKKDDLKDIKDTLIIVQGDIKELLGRKRTE